MDDKKKLALSMLGAVMLMLPAYIFFHELGHSLVAIACGAKITRFSIVTAHMSYNGGNFNQIMKSLFNAAGMLLPVLVCLLLVLLYNRNKKNIFYYCFLIMFYIITVSSIFAWIIVPFVSMFSTPPSGDDVAKFLQSSQWNPLAVVICAILLITVMLITASYKGVFKPFTELKNKGAFM